MAYSSKGLASRTIALPSFNAARNSAVLISGLPATLLRTPSKTFGASRPSADGCDCTFDQAAIAVINIIPRINTIPACRPVVIDQLLLFVPRVLRDQHSMTSMLKEPL